MSANVVLEDCPYWYIPYRNLSLAVIAESKADLSFILSKMLDFWCSAAGLSTERTRNSLLGRIKDERTRRAAKDRGGKGNNG